MSTFNPASPNINDLNTDLNIINDLTKNNKYSVTFSMTSDALVAVNSTVTVPFSSMSLITNSHTDSVFSSGWYIFMARLIIGTTHTSDITSTNLNSTSGWRFVFLTNGTELLRWGPNNFYTFNYSYVYFVYRRNQEFLNYDLNTQLVQIINPTNPTINFVNTHATYPFIIKAGSFFTLIRLKDN
jgi:hypothetical protein